MVSDDPVKSLRQILAFAASTWLLLPGVSAGSIPAQCSVLDKYSVVLDSVFPADWDQCRGSSPLSSGGPQITIRILPNFFQESQVFIFRVEPGRYFVVSSTLDPKDKTIWGHMLKSRRINDLVSESIPATESAEEIVAVIHVIHKSCKFDSRIVDGWFRKLTTIRMRLPLSEGGFDWTYYEVTLRHGRDLMQAKIWAGDGKKQEPLITLVDNIYREIEKANCTQIQRIPKKA
jgi:hypothetical protein